MVTVVWTTWSRSLRCAGQRRWSSSWRIPFTDPLRPTPTPMASPIRSPVVHMYSCRYSQPLESEFIMYVGGLSSLFNWGGGSSSKTSTNISTIQSSTNASSKQQLDKVRAALAPLKLRFAILLADFGLTKEAAEYARGVRAIVKEADTGWCILYFVCHCMM